MSDITYMEEQKYIPSCSVIISRLMLTKISGGRRHATVQILFLKCDSKMQKYVKYNFHHNVTHLSKVSVQGFITEKELLIADMQVLPCNFFFHNNFVFIHLFIHTCLALCFYLFYLFYLYKTTFKTESNKFILPNINYYLSKKSK